MKLPDRLVAALQALDGAVDLLEAAVDRRALADAARSDLETELALMQEDRARLAEDLEASRLQNESLTSASTEVARRLDRVGQTLETLLGESVPPDPVFDAVR